jgi:hypothetical protein
MAPEKNKVSEKKRLLLYFLLFISLISILFACYLGVRILQRVGHRPPPIPRQTDVSLIQEWMTVPFIARSYKIPEAILYEKLEIDPLNNRKSNLSSIATKTGKSTPQIINQIKNVISEFQKNQPSPPPN